MWPFATLTEAQAWEREFRSGGHQPWHRDPAQTALSFTQGYLGFKEIDRITSRKVSGSDARIGVGRSGPEQAAPRQSSTSCGTAPARTPHGRSWAPTTRRSL